MLKISIKLIPALIIALALVACGKKEEAQPPAPAQPSAEAAKGEKVFKVTCSMCHQTGAAGAPLFGKKEEWAPRIAQGMPALYDHAIKGFTGKNGMMPAKGGNPSLSDDDVKAGVDYMVSKAK